MVDVIIIIKHAGINNPTTIFFKQHYFVGSATSVNKNFILTSHIPGILCFTIESKNIFARSSDNIIRNVAEISYLCTKFTVL